MFRPMHFVLFFLAIAYVVATPVPGEADIVQTPEQGHVGLKPDASDLEADASGWGYAQPWYGKSGWYGRGGGWYGRGGGWYGKNYGWGGRGYGWW